MDSCDVNVDSFFRRRWRLVPLRSTGVGDGASGEEVMGCNADGDALRLDPSLACNAARRPSVAALMSFDDPARLNAGGGG